MIFYILLFSFGYGMEDSKKTFCPLPLNEIMASKQVGYSSELNRFIGDNINFKSMSNIDCTMLKPIKNKEQIFIIGSPVDHSVEPINHQQSIIGHVQPNTHKQFLMVNSTKVFSPLDSTPLKFAKKETNININQAHRFQNNIKNIFQIYKNLDTKNENLYKQNQKQETIIHQLQKQIKDINGEKSQLFQELMDEKQKNIQLEKQMESITHEKTKQNPPSTPKKSPINFTSNPVIMEFTSYKSPLKCFLDDKNNEINHQSFLRELTHFEQKIHQLLKENIQLFEENNALKEKFDQLCQAYDK